MAEGKGEMEREGVMVLMALMLGDRVTSLLLEALNTPEALRTTEGELEAQLLGTIEEENCAELVAVGIDDTQAVGDEEPRIVTVFSDVGDGSTVIVDEAQPEAVAGIVAEFAIEPVTLTVPLRVGREDIEGEAVPGGDGELDGVNAADPEFGDTEGMLVTDGAAVPERVVVVDTVAVSEARTGMLTMHVCTAAARNVLEEGVDQAGPPAAAE